MADPKPSDATSEQFVCPECGKSFSRAAALGSHRRRVHGVAGSSRAATGARTSSSRRRRKTAAAAASSTTPPSPAAPSRSVSRAKTPSRRHRAVGRSRSSATTNGQFDRNQLLRTLFPNGVPPREDVLRAVNGWLDEAERLTRLK